MLGIGNFIMVLVFNLLWLLMWGKEGYINAYLGRGLPKYLTVGLWFYGGWGIFNLIWAIVV